MNVLSLLAQEGDLSFTQRYFSFIALGLMLCIGYVVWRMTNPGKAKNQESTLENELQEAEREARERKRNEDKK